MNHRGCLILYLAFSTQYYVWESTMMIYMAAVYFHYHEGFLYMNIQWFIHSTIDDI